MRRDTDRAVLQRYQPRQRLLARLLSTALHGSAPHELDDVSTPMVRWAVDGGLGPLLRAATTEDSSLARSSAWPMVVGADLAARFRSEAHLHALEEILDACGKRIPPLTLLKGMSLGIERYPAPHLRTMGDIDVLVDREWIRDAERITRELGYRPPKSSADYRHHHHVAPLVHPETDVCIELHHALFSSRTALAADAVFSDASVRAERRAASFRDRPIYHLSPEMQLVYVPAHWAQSPVLLVGGGGLRSMLDTMLILRDASTLRWPAILDWLDGAAVAGPVYLMLAYLDARALVAVDAAILDDIRRRQTAFGPLGLRLAFRLLDDYAFENRRFRLPVGARTLALIWTGLLQHGGWWPKMRSMSSRLGAGARRRWSPQRP